MDLSAYLTYPSGTKVPMECCKPGKKTACVFVNDTQVRFWCARCGHAEVLRRKRSFFGLQKFLPAPTQTTFKTCIPADIQDVQTNPEAIAHLCKYNLLYTVYEESPFWYSPYMRRLVLPIRSWTGECVGAQYRALYPDQQPKYLTMADQPSAHYIGPDTADAVVVVEDILSAHKILESVYLQPPDLNIRVAAVLGTHLTAHKLVTLTRRPNHVSKVIFWFDSDEAGTKAAFSGKGSAELLGLKSTCIRTSNDPKAVSRDNIRAYILAAMEELC